MRAAPPPGPAVEVAAYRRVRAARIRGTTRRSGTADSQPRQSRPASPTRMMTVLNGASGPSPPARAAGSPWRRRRASSLWQRRRFIVERIRQPTTRIRTGPLIRCQAGAATRARPLLGAHLFVIPRVLRSPTAAIRVDHMRARARVRPPKGAVIPGRSLREARPRTSVLTPERASKRSGTQESDAARLRHVFPGHPAAAHEGPALPPAPGRPRSGSRARFPPGTFFLSLDKSVATTTSVRSPIVGSGDGGAAAIPRLDGLEGGSGSQHATLGEARPHDLHANRQALDVPAAGHRDGRLAGQVEWVREWAPGERRLIPHR